MKINKIIWIFIIVFINACTTQKQIIAREGYSGLEHNKNGMSINTNKRLDVIVADIASGSMFSFLFSANSLSDSHFFDLSPQATGLMDLEYKNTKQFSFYDGEKDMEIECKCRPNYNYYIKNLKIEDGNYVLTFKKRTEIKGDEIKTSDKVQNILFKNIGADKYGNPENRYFKDLEFTVLDLSDTLNVKLVKKQ